MNTNQRFRSAAGLAAVFWVNGGASAARPPLATTAASSGIVVTSGEELPPGAGKAILDRACTSCHGLNEVTKFRGFYNRPQWRDIVVTMVEYGAVLTSAEVESLADYLVKNLGKVEK